MRLIDADILIKQLEKCKNNAIGTYPISIVDSNIELVNKQPTAYDVDKVVEQIHEIGTSFCDNVKCNKDCNDCEHGCIMRAVEGQVKEGGVNDTREQEEYLSRNKTK